MLAYLEDLKLAIDNYILDYFVILRDREESLPLWASFLSFWASAKNPLIKWDPSAYASGWQCDGHSDPEPKPWAEALSLCEGSAKGLWRVCEGSAKEVSAKGLLRGRIPSLFHHSDFSIIECLHSGQPFVAFIPNNERMSSRNLFPIGNFRIQNFFLTKISFFMV